MVKETPLALLGGFLKWNQRARHWREAYRKSVETKEKSQALAWIVFPILCKIYYFFLAYVYLMEFFEYDSE